ncbi:glycoside hydrolase family 3 C-terminal domain-containing protein [Micromonospora sp. DT81.3]|uniref:glycoside hydrolase family 3 C-terminal domain-containing protein n=1 Tax=Micromonospora sp. DT81.3 TaxID=3416523 RepID=UPI003CEC8528
MNTALSPDERAALVLQEMTLEEKVELMTGDQGEAPSAFYNGPIDRLGIPELRMADATAGIASRGWTLPGTGDTATALPANQALAATWDPDRARDYAGVVADEARQTGHEMLLGPNSDPTRNPFWGRQAETASEDPDLNSSMVVPFVQTVQERNVIANLKHYTGYTQEVNRGLGQNSIIDERALHEVHTYAYENAIREADLGSVMCSFNKINGVYACEDEYALDTVLRDQLGFTGFVITDFGAIHSTVPSIVAGTDMETGTAAFYDGALLAAVQSGEVPVSLVDRSVLRILRTMFAIGVFDNDYTPTAIPVEEHGAIAREVEEDAITLLQNEDGVLPLDPAVGSVAVIGGDANIPSALSGSAYVQPTYTVSLVDALTARGAATGAEVRYEPGNDPVTPANMIETADMTAVPSSVLRPEVGDGNGLTARYYPTADWSGPAGVERTERQVAYDVGFLGGGPAFASLYASQVEPTPSLGGPAGGGDQSVRYTGTLAPPTSGTYVLGATGWGDARVYMNDELIIDMTGENGRRDVRSAPLELTAGEEYDLRVEYSQTRPLVGLQPGTFLLQWSTPEGALSPSAQLAVEAAASSDVAVVYVRTLEGEERDRVSLKLPQSADQLISAVTAVNPNTVVVLATGGGVTMPWLDQAPAVLQSYFGGQEEGNALTSILFGDEDPSGHLPISYPRSESELPLGVENPWAGIDNLDVEFSEGVNVGYRGYLAAGVDPLFAFGHGLSYTDFSADQVKVGKSIRTTGGKDTVDVQLRLDNVGDRTGTEVVQVYLGALPGVDSPPLKLAGYAKVELDAGTGEQVKITLDRRDFSYWNSDADKWVVPTGDVAVYLGTSAAEVEQVGTVKVVDSGIDKRIRAILLKVIAWLKLHPRADLEEILRARLDNANIPVTEEEIRELVQQARELIRG